MLWFCSFAIETTFPLSNFKTKHIFGILMKRVKFLLSFEAPEALQFFYIFFTAAQGGGFPNGRRSLWRVFRECFLLLFYCIKVEFESSPVSESDYSKWTIWTELPWIMLLPLPSKNLHGWAKIGPRGRVSFTEKWSWSAAILYKSTLYKRAPLPM